MKIRFRRNGEPIERTVIEESPSFYLVENAPGLLPLVCEKASWEEVAPAPKWVDVTAVFSAGDLMFAPHKGKGGPGYRLRKVQRREIPSMMDYAFIIEKEEP